MNPLLHCQQYDEVCELLKEATAKFLKEQSGGEFVSTETARAWELALLEAAAAMRKFWHGTNSEARQEFLNLAGLLFDGKSDKRLEKLITQKYTQ